MYESREREREVYESRERVTKEKGKDHRCNKGNVEIVFPSLNLVKHALFIYTIKAFLVFEKEFVVGGSSYHQEFGMKYSNKVFKVGGTKIVRNFAKDEQYNFS